MDDETPDVEDERGYGIGAVSRMLGVPVPTLRTWNLRYGIGAGRRSPGGHRRYSATDVRRLTEMNRLIQAGLVPADAARAALDLPPEPAGAPPPHEGRIVSAEQVARAAALLDDQMVADAVQGALSRYGVEWTWERLVRPVFETICLDQAGSGRGVEIEHLFSDRVQAALGRLVVRPAVPALPRPVLLACAEDEQHSLPVHALAATLAAEHDVEVRVLGARTPYVALGDAMRRLAPGVVFVWSQMPATGDPAPLAALAAEHPGQIVVGGPGWWEGLPAGVRRATSLAEAIREVTATLA